MLSTACLLALLLGFVAAGTPPPVASSRRIGIVHCDDDDGDDVACIDELNDDGDHFFRVCNDDSIDIDLSAMGTSCGSKKRDVKASRDVEIDVGFAYKRTDASQDSRATCGPEFRLLIDDQVIAHTNAEIDGENPIKYPTEGEGSFDVKVELETNKEYKISLQVRDGAGCDIFDDDDDAESSSEAFLSLPGITAVAGGLRKRNVEGSDDDDDDGTTVDLSELREAVRFPASSIKLYDAIKLEISDDDDDDDSDDDDDARKRQFNYFA